MKASLIQFTCSFRSFFVLATMLLVCLYVAANTSSKVDSSGSLQIAISFLLAAFEQSKLAAPMTLGTAIAMEKSKACFILWSPQTLGNGRSKHYQIKKEHPI